MTLNIPNLTKVAELLEDASAPERMQMGFCMRTFHGETNEPGNGSGSIVHDFSLHNCGTAGCLMAWSFIALASKPMTEADLEDKLNCLNEHASLTLQLGISIDEAFRLFYPDNYHRMSSGPKQAANVVRRLIRTRRVDWGPDAIFDLTPDGRPEQPYED